jgi:hypothetical protein
VRKGWIQDLEGVGKVHAELLEFGMGRDSSMGLRGAWGIDDGAFHYAMVLYN